MQDFNKIYQANADIVYRYLFSLTHNADLAEELTQQTFCEAISHPSNFRGDAALSSYLCGIAKNLAKKEFARQARHDYVPLEDVIDGPVTSSAEEEVSEKMQRAELFHRIHGLPEQMREVVYLRLAGELTFAEIGTILNKTENWARVTFYRAKQRLMEGGM